ncbi:xylulokinase [Caballeronia arationis]|jgi:xylulokinase|uniref:Xylulokinase n=1 Tax=Caballeronia arationis TaxID=1777142 RepID=A0A7Z7IA03_9BURK|nr:FGGY family carbohydrate kinase [Caballeronia arationis]SAK81667.1 xylulokinase [Caballeronia arationis]SOE80731.1 xylulokinase [Caballeronia arationis]
MRFLGIDLGTASLKLAIVDEHGREIAFSNAAYAVRTEHPGWAETPVDDWWNALVAAASRLPAAEREAVRAIGFSGQMHGVVLTDEQGRALRPAMLWPDTRARDLLDAWPLPQVNPVAPGMAGPLLRWIALNEPALLDEARWALQPKDWLRTRLGGEMDGAIATDPSDACATALAEPSGLWDDASIAKLGLPRTWFAQLAPSYAAAGTLSAEAATALGLKAGVVMAVGAGDTPCAALGSGLCRDGDALLTTGTGGQIVVMSHDAPASVAGLHAYRAATDEWYQMAAMQNVGVALEAVRGWLAFDAWPRAYEDAFAAQPSARVSFLPYLSGERSPWMNPAARGGWLGLGLGDTRGTLMRAAFEGVAFSLRAGLDAIRSSGATIAAMRLAGGGSIDPRWRQLLADALKVELHAVDCPNAATRGAALLGGLAVGHWHAGDLATLAPSTTLAATPRDDAALDERHARFIDLYGRVKDWF